MDRLISMVDYCQEVSKEFMAPKKPFDKNEWFGKILNYSDFLKQPLTLGMFVPCDFEGNVLEPINEEYPNNVEYFEEIKAYDEAKDRVLFEGFKCIKWEHGGDSYSVRKNHGTYKEVQVCYYKDIPDYFVWSFETVEQLCSKDLELTPTALKQIGYE